MADMLWYLSLPTLSLVSSTGQVVLFGIIAWYCLKQYQRWHHPMLLKLIVGSLCFMASSLLDNIGRYQIFLIDESTIWLLLRVSGVMFYFGAYLFLWGIFSLHNEIPQWRLNLYTAIYGAMIVYYMSTLSSYLYFEDSVGIYYLIFPGTFYVYLNTAVSLPVVDFILLIKRRLSSSNRFIPHINRSLVFFLIGTVLASIVPSSDTPKGYFLVSQLFAIGVFLLMISFIMNPLAIATTSSKLVELYIIRSENMIVPVFAYNFEKQLEIDSRQQSLTVAILSATTDVIGELTHQEGPSVGEFSYLTLGKYSIIVFHGQYLSGYLLLVNSGNRIFEIDKIPLKTLILDLEKRMTDGDKAKTDTVTQKMIAQFNLDLVIPMIFSLGYKTMSTN